MRATLLIARREYLSYVATWGFWLSLLAVPIFAAIGGITPALIQSSQPVRYYAVIDETGQGLDRMVAEARETQSRERIRDALEEAARTFGGSEAADQALAIFDQDPEGITQAETALNSFGETDLVSLIEAGQTKAVQVPAPSSDIDELRPYLTGDATIMTDEGEKGLFAAFVIRPHPDNGFELVYVSANLTNTELRDSISRVVRSYMREQAFTAEGLDLSLIETILDLEPTVTSLDARGEAGAEEEVTLADQAPFIVAIALAFVLWMAVFSVANMLLTSLIEEKGGKIIELLLSTARFQDILIGKLLGVAAVSVTLFMVWGGVGVLLSTAGGSALASFSPELLDILRAVFDPGLLLAALFFFAFGYLMYGAIFLAMGSLCDTLQDAQTLMGPVIWALMLPMLILVFSLQALDSMVVQIASWIPLWTPFIMMARLPSEPPLWEVLGSSALMIATTLAVLWGASAVFRQGALRQASADSVRKLFKLGKK